MKSAGSSASPPASRPGNAAGGLRAGLWALAALLYTTASAAPAMAAGTEIGTYYFPGWHRDPFTGNKDTWEPIRRYPEREPQRGWYDDSDPNVLRAQANEMKAAGIGFVVFDWYFEDGKVQASAPLDAYLRLSGVPRASILWARHGKSPPTTTAQWRTIVAAWTRYAGNRNFYRIDGRPVVMIFDTGRMAKEARQAGSDLAGWVEIAQQAARKAKLRPFHFVAGVWNGNDPTIEEAAKAGFAGITSYNDRRAPEDPRDAHGFAERDGAYRRVWQKMAANRPGLPLILPLTSGWDRRAWGGSEDRMVDNSTPSDPQFRTHLLAARAFMRGKGLKRAVICCWNEYGEGSVIEPTRVDGDARLKAIREIFKSD